MTVTGVRWAESRNRQESHGVITVRNGAKLMSNSEDFRSTRQGGAVLVNDNDESRKMVEQCYKRRKTTVNPIIDWEDRDVWDFIQAEKIPYCELYNEGFHRLGCIGCPMGGHARREKDFARWPKYKTAYLKSFEKMIELRKERNARDPSKPVWIYKGIELNDPTPTDIFNWWMEYDVLPGQYDLFEDYEIEED